MIKLDKLIDLFMFREGSEEDDYSTKPVVTTGSIVWGVLFRFAIIIVVSLSLMNYIDWKFYWWTVFIAIWFFVAYPAHRQYEKFYIRMDKFEEETLCGSCKYFSSTGQLCTMYDEHVSKTHIPCDGESWEPKQFS